MRRLAVTGAANRPGKKDFSAVFAPEALRFIRGGDDGSMIEQVITSQSRATQRDLIAEAIVETRPEEIGFFCHGLSRKIELGYDLATVGSLAVALEHVGCTRVGLYACSTASGPGVGGDGGFADALRDEMSDARTRIVAHSTAGHATSNPHVRIFDGATGVGGVDVVPRGSPLWRRWCQRLRDADDSLRWDLLRLTLEEIRAALA